MLIILMPLERDSKEFKTNLNNSKGILTIQKQIRTIRTRFEAIEHKFEPLERDFKHSKTN